MNLIFGDDAGFDPNVILHIFSGDTFAPVSTARSWEVLEEQATCCNCLGVPDNALLAPTRAVLLNCNAMDNEATDVNSKTKPEVDNLGLAIVKGACHAESKDIAIDFAQFGLAELFGETVLKEIPVLKTVLACYKVPLAVRDQLFLRKVAGFLRAVPDFSAEEKQKFLDDHFADPNKAKKLGETLILLLDRLDDMDKPQMIARAFAAFVRGQINLDIFRRLGIAIDQGAVADLNEFIRTKPSDPSQPRRPDKDTQTLRTNLARTGLVSLPTFTGTAPITGVSFRENDLGKIFREIMNGAEVERA